MKVILTIVVTILFASVSAENVSACECVEYDVPYCEQVSRADTIFVGTVKSIRKNDRSTDVLEESLIQFEVEQIFKGSTPPTVDVSYFFGTSCSWLKFEIGERWVVYGYRRNHGALLTIPFCTGSHRMSETSDDITFLTNLKQGKNAESIRGRVTSYDDGPIKDAPIAVTNEKGTFTGKANSEGRYEISVPSPGKYNVKVSVPFSAALVGHNPDLSIIDMFIGESKSVLEYGAIVDKGLCSYQQLNFNRVDLKANASISGRLVDSDGKPIASGFVYLSKWDIQEDTSLKNRELEPTDENGNFSFKGLREGRYVVLLNPGNFPGKDQPYLRSYLPGVPSFEEAFVIELGRGKQIEVPNFKLPKKLRTRTIEIQVVWPDGKPVLKEHPNAKMDRLPWFSVNRSDGTYFEHPDATRSGDGKYSITVYTGFPYVIGVQVTGSDNNFWNGFVQVPSDEVSKTLKIVLGPKTGDASDFIERLKGKIH